MSDSMKRALLIWAVVLTAGAACAQKPATADDLRILTKAADLLKDESVWNRPDDRQCEDDEKTGKRSLFCALQRACIDVCIWGSPITDESRCRRFDSPSRMPRAAKISSIVSATSTTSLQPGWRISKRSFRSQRSV